jgi:hypothetical protein
VRAVPGRDREIRRSAILSDILHNLSSHRKKDGAQKPIVRAVIAGEVCRH